jgi:hypothetical protein
MIMFHPRSRRERARDRAEAIDRVIEQVLTWPDVTMAPHQFDSVEFQLDGTEFGHLNRSGRLDVPFVRRIRNALVDEGAADAHPWVPNSGWLTFDVGGSDDADNAVYLLRLSYLYRTIVTRGGDVDFEALRRELDSLDLPRRLVDIYDSLLSRYLESTAHEA